jgi:hypothetical protein
VSLVLWEHGRLLRLKWTAYASKRKRNILDRAAKEDSENFNRS